MQGFLKDTFRDHAPEPPRDLWAGIEGELRPRKRLAWLPYASAVAALLVVVVGLMWILAGDEAARQQLAPVQPMASTQMPLPQAHTTQTHTTTLPHHTQHAALHQQSPVSQPVVTEDNGVIPPDPALAHIAVVPVAGKPAPVSVSGNYSRPLPMPGLQPVTLAAAPQQPAPSRKQEYDLSKLTVDDVLLFAARSLGRVADLPFAVYADNANPQQVKAYQVQLGQNFSIERKRATP